MKKPTGINPVLRAVLVAKWERRAVEAQIQALIGQDANKIADEVGRIVYVLLGAALLDGISEHDQDVAKVRYAASALYDLAGSEEVLDELRQAVLDGLDAGGRLCEVLSNKSMRDAAIDLHFMLQVGDLNWSAFESLGATV